MTKRYRSKVTLVLAIPLGLILIGVGVLMLWNGLMMAAALVLAVMLAIVYLYFSTVYEITESGILKIKSGLGVHAQIPAEAICEIKPSRSLLAAPAWSNDRLEIIYQPGLSVLVSPVQRETFIHDLLSLQPGIRVENTALKEHA